MSHVDQRQMCIELLLASADTSSVTLYYTLVLLAQREDLRQELVAEIEASPAGEVGWSISCCACAVLCLYVTMLEPPGLAATN